MAASGFPSLCRELSTMQLRVLRRQASVTDLRSEAVRLIHDHLDTLQATTANTPYIPLFLKACAALLPPTPTSPATGDDDDERREVLGSTSRLARHYIGAQYGDVNEASTVLRSVLTLDRNHRAAAVAVGGDGSSGMFAGLVQPAYTVAYDKWRQQRTRPSTLSVLSLLAGTDAVYGSHFQFPPTSHDMRGLLPCKGRVPMEAKLQRCIGARELLASLREMDFNRLDAGMCLNIMAESGLYDEDVCSRSCSALYTAHALVTSQQMCEVLYSLGVLQYRHVHAKFFSSLVNPKQCDAHAVLKHAMALAMLQQPPAQQRYLLDGVFLHALRSRPSKDRGQGSASRERRLTDAQEVADRGQEGDPRAYVLPDLWYIDMSYALACLSITAPRFQLMTARQVRRSVARLTTPQRCKLLYGIGSPRLQDVPPELQASWASKVDRLKDILYMKLEDIAAEDGPQVASTLHYCGVHEHPSIPSVPDLAAARENPADVILRAWARSTPEHILALTESIEPHHLGGDAAAKVAQVVSRVADSCGPPLPHDRYRVQPLVAAVEATSARMSTDEALRTLSGLQRMNLTGHYRASLEGLMEALWSKRADLSEGDLQRCLRAAASLPRDADVATRFTAYAVAKAAPPPAP